MTNRSAIGLLLFLLLIYGVATLVFDDPGVFLAKKLLDLISAVAFWR